MGEEAAIKGTTNLTEKLGNPVAIKLKGNAWEGGASARKPRVCCGFLFFCLCRIYWALHSIVGSRLAAKTL